MPPTVRKILHWLVWGFLIYAIVTNPDRAADIVRTAWDIAWSAVTNVGRFFNRLMYG